MRVAVFLACIALAFAWQPEKRVSGGQLAPVGSRPYMASILRDDYQLSVVCGGALIHKDWVVTSATCANYGDDVYVGLGYYDLYESSDATEIVHGTWHVNPNYGFTPFYANNIALIKLDTSVTLSDRIQTINMPKKDSEPAIGTSMLVSGWGVSAVDGGLSHELSQTVVTTSDLKSVCRAHYDKIQMDDSIICSDSTNNFCQGDDGGPAVTNYDESSSDGTEVLTALVAKGYSCKADHKPSLYTRVSAHCDWIDSETGHDVQCN
ncbi:trypsin-like [Asterias amurensis]|uniref:trypsin-like n=1 Tax=Asterias amurensis TaxID=7602 RepID=UPI003AB8770A